jgi:transposase
MGQGPCGKRTRSDIGDIALTSRISKRVAQRTPSAGCTQDPQGANLIDLTSESEQGDRQALIPVVTVRSKVTCFDCCRYLVNTEGRLSTTRPYEFSRDSVA